MSVFIDGATISSLFYSHSGSLGNQEGFLFGRIISHVKDHISDSQINNSEVQTYMYVFSHMPWPSEDRVYSRGGIPIMEKLGAILGERKGEVIGWYSFRRCSSLRMSLKEKTLHRNLADKFCSQAPEDFLFCLCVSSTSSDCSTHSMEHCFVTVKRRTGTWQLTRLPVMVTNLGDTSHKEYKTLGNSSSMQTGSVQNMICQFKSEFVAPHSEDMKEVLRVDSMSDFLNKNLVKLCAKVAKSEEKRGNLEEEVSIVKKQLAQREEEIEKQRQMEMEKQQQVQTEKQQQMLMNPAEPEPGTSTVDGPLKQVTDLYPHLPARVDIGLLGKGDAASLEENEVASHSKGQKENGFSGKDAGLLAAEELRPSVDDLLCVSEPSSGITAPQLASERLVSQPDELIDLEASNSDESLEGRSVSSGVEIKDNQTGPSPNQDERAGKNDAVHKSDKHLKAKASLPKQRSDHFAFVDNIVKNESSRKTARVPVGQTLTHTARATRSQVKGDAGSDSKQPVREKGKVHTSSKAKDSVRDAAASGQRSASPSSSRNVPRKGASAVPDSQKGSATQLCDSQKDSATQLRETPAAGRGASGTSEAKRNSAELHEPVATRRGSSGSSETQKGSYAQQPDTGSTKRNSSESCEAQPPETAATKRVTSGSSETVRSSAKLSEAGATKVLTSEAGETPPSLDEPSAPPSQNSSQSDKNENISSSLATARELRLKKRLDPRSVSQSHQSKITRSGRTVASTAGHVLHENGTDSKEKTEAPLSSSPVF